MCPDPAGIPFPAPTALPEPALGYLREMRNSRTASEQTRCRLLWVRPGTAEPPRLWLFQRACVPDIASAGADPRRYIPAAQRSRDQNSTWEQSSRVGQPRSAPPWRELLALQPAGGPGSAGNAGLALEKRHCCFRPGCDKAWRVCQISHSR